MLLALDGARTGPLSERSQDSAGLRLRYWRVKRDKDHGTGRYGLTAK